MKNKDGISYSFNKKYIKRTIDIAKISVDTGLNHDSLKNYFAKGEVTCGPITEKLKECKIIKKGH